MSSDPAIETNANDAAGLVLDDSYDISKDPSLKLSNQKVAEAREAVKNGTDRVYRIYTDGIFDLFHVGHMQMLKQAKFALNNPANVELIAGVCSDADTRKYKGKFVMKESIRGESLRHCRWVDEVIEDAPWIITPEFVDKHRIDFVAHDAVPYDSAGCDDVYAFVKSRGMFLATQRTDGISTTDIIVQIVRDYDDHVVRNLQRGVDKQKLNVGRTWAIRMVAHEKERQLRLQMQKMRAEQQIVVNLLKRLSSCLVPNNNSNNTLYLKQYKNDNSNNNNNNNNDDNSSSNTKSTTSQRQNKKHAGFETLCQEDDNDNDNTNNVEDKQMSLCEELTQVSFHCYKLTAAVCSTGLAVASYFNVWTYIQMCRKTDKQ